MVSYTTGTGRAKKVNYYVFLEGFKETDTVTFASLLESDGKVAEAGKNIIIKVNPNIVK